MDVRIRWKIARIIITSVYLFGGWVLFTWSVALYSLLLGFLFSIIVAMVSYRFFIDTGEAARKSLLPRYHFIFIYALVLLYEIYAASFKVAVKVFSGRINPRVVHFRTKLKSEIARVLLANSITLTPGTITIEIDEDHLVVHWLNAKTTHSHYAGKLIKEKFETWLRRIWM